MVRKAQVTMVHLHKASPDVMVKVLEALMAAGAQIQDTMLGGCQRVR